MRILVNERLSEHRVKTPEGYLICMDAILARTGKQTYRHNEIFKDSDDESEIEIDRPEAEVFSDKTLASFENKPITDEHPDEDVNVNNYKEHAIGFVRDIRRAKDGDQDVMIGNLVITDKDAIEEIESGERTELSCGYDCEIADDNGQYIQKNIRGNHVALCEHGRAGNARIIDSENVNDAQMHTYEICYIDYSEVCIAIVAKSEQDAIRKFRRDYGYYTIVHVKQKDSIDDSAKFYVVICENDDVYVAESIDRAKHLAKAWDGDVYEVDGNIEFYRQTLKKFGQRAAYDEWWNDRRKGKARLVDAKKLPANVKRDLQKFLSHKSTYLKNKDYDISEFVREFERVAKLWVEFPINVTRESIKGWYKTDDGMYRKDYTFSVDGYDDEFIVSVYADDDFKTTELNAYFTDSINDSTDLVVGQKVLIKEKASWANGEWGIIKYIDGDEYHVAIANDPRQALIFNKKSLKAMKDSVDDTVMHGQIWFVPGDKVWMLETVSKSGKYAYKTFRSKEDAVRYAKSNNIAAEIDDEETINTKDTTSYRGKRISWDRKAIYGRILSENDPLSDKTSIEVDNGRVIFVSSKLLEQAIQSGEAKLRDAIVEPDADDLKGLEKIFEQNGFKVESLKKNLFGGYHYQIRSTQTYPKEKFKETVVQIARKIDAYKTKTGCSITWNFGHMDDGTITAGVDVHDKYVKDSMKEFIVKHNDRKFKVKAASPKDAVKRVAKLK